MKYLGHYMLQISVTSPSHTYITFTVTNTNCRIQNSAYKEYVCNNYDKVSVTSAKHLV